jgi:nitrogen fixation NifU-like protein
MEHFFQPRNVGEIKDADGESTVGDLQCGDFIKVWIKVDDGRIADFKYKVFGCGAAIATTSVVSELSIGKTFEEAIRLTDSDVIVALGGLPSNKEHCSLLGVRGLHSALADYLVKDNHKRYEQRFREYLKMGYDMKGSRAKIVQRLDGLPRTAKILDVGTGKGHLALAIAQSGRKCISIDISAEEQHIAELNAIYYGVDDRIDLQLQDVSQMTFENGFFDVVLSATALHHIAETELALQEILRVTQKGGKIILADHNENGEKIVNEMHRNEGRTHQSLGWDRRKIQSWFKKQKLQITCQQDECLWVLEIEKA